MRRNDTYSPQDIGEVIDLLAMMLSCAPRFVDDSGYFPDRTIDTVFSALANGLEAVRPQIGEGRYERLVELAAQARRQFEADPEDKNGGTKTGCDLIHEIESILVAGDRSHAPG